MISVALAYYNGKTYIKEQLSSILEQLGPDDEVVISIDGATDGSMELLEEYRQTDSRIRLIEGPHKGPVKNFENAIEACQGDIIFLSDQDDIWKKDKVKKVVTAFEKNPVDVILHNAKTIDEEGKDLGEASIFEFRGSRSGILKNIIKNSYMGCCMAFRKELKDVILPIPDEMYMHDYWIGTAGEKMGGTGLLKECLIGYRRHGNNVTEMTHGSLSFMIRKRIDILKCLSILNKRVAAVKRGE